MMKQFDLNEWLQDKNRKVVTRRGNLVRIICSDRKHGEDDLPIVFLEEINGGEFLLTCRNDGRSDNYDTQYDLFFADDEEQLTELQTTLEEDCDYYVNLYNDGTTREELREWIKGWCPRIIDLARKELEENYYTTVLDDRMVFKSELHVTDLQFAYSMGKQDALKDLPKWKKFLEEYEELDFHAILLEDNERVVLTDHLEKGDYYIKSEDLKTLPKED